MRTFNERVNFDLDICSGLELAAITRPVKQNHVLRFRQLHKHNNCVYFIIAMRVLALFSSTRETYARGEEQYLVISLFVSIGVCIITANTSMIDFGFEEIDSERK